MRLLYFDKGCFFTKKKTLTLLPFNHLTHSICVLFSQLVFSFCGCFCINFTLDLSLLMIKNAIFGFFSIHFILIQRKICRSVFCSCEIHAFILFEIDWWYDCFAPTNTTQLKKRCLAKLICMVCLLLWCFFLKKKHNMKSCSSASWNACYISFWRATQKGMHMVLHLFVIILWYLNYC